MVDELGVARLIKRQSRLIDRLCDALSWCGGSADFAPRGKARRGWLRVVVPLLREADHFRFVEAHPSTEGGTPPNKP